MNEEQIKRRYSLSVLCRLVYPLLGLVIGTYEWKGIQTIPLPEEIPRPAVMSKLEHLGRSLRKYDIRDVCYNEEIREEFVSMDKEYNRLREDHKTKLTIERYDEEVSRYKTLSEKIEGLHDLNYLISILLAGGPSCTGVVMAERKMRRRLKELRENELTN